MRGDGLESHVRSPLLCWPIQSGRGDECEPRILSELGRLCIADVTRDSTGGGIDVRCLRQMISTADFLPYSRRSLIAQPTEKLLQRRINVEYASVLITTRGAVRRLDRGLNEKGKARARNARTDGDDAGVGVCCAVCVVMRVASAYRRPYPSTAARISRDSIACAQKQLVKPPVAAYSRGEHIVRISTGASSGADRERTEHRNLRLAFTRTTVVLAQRKRGHAGTDPVCSIRSDVPGAEGRHRCSLQLTRAIDANPRSNVHAKRKTTWKRREVRILPTSAAIEGCSGCKSGPSIRTIPSPDKSRQSVGSSAGAGGTTRATTEHPRYDA
ncbi:hypothetical protein FB451DRAFT_1177613 [Mycena latifolia]|nr:hypothetical protein FB451DRAFT_1177613 [Mycena latifolia]